MFHLILVAFSVVWFLPTLLTSKAGFFSTCMKRHKSKAGGLEHTFNHKARGTSQVGKPFVLLEKDTLLSQIRFQFCCCPGKLQQGLEAWETPPCCAQGWHSGDSIGRWDSEDAGPPTTLPPFPLPFLSHLHTVLWLGGHLFPTASQNTVAERGTMVPYKGRCEAVFHL